MKKGNVKSIRAVLKNISDKERIDFQLIVIRYLHERFLYRVSVSAYAKHFFLKGGILLFAIKGLHIRPTVDIDMLAIQLSNDKEQLHRIFQTICSIEYDDDCVIFNIDSIKTEDIAADAKYSGVRILIDAGLDTIRQQLQIDIGFSDVITPAPVNLVYPTLLSELAQPFQIGAYSIETVVAEKFHAMIALGVFNSRMKDFYDVY
ncbi:MAG: nucleotidyl transferase AbiEii/AbiGii toxin family protein, partial [Tannerellaceae bacterium]|nr:nucleotidyl transferase AbiEii/AbiGii toxin family protein [Tannerellaceae bacterium]